MFRVAVGLATRCLGKPIIRSLVSSGPTAVRQFAAVTQPFVAISRHFSVIARPQLLQSIPYLRPASKQLMEPKPLVMFQQVRSVTKRSIGSGRRKTVKHVIRGFYRLHWGIWIRPRAGRNKNLWRKSGPRKRRLQNHVFCTATQSTMLDKMVTAFWKRPKYWVDDPYEPFHQREEFHMTRKKPLPAHSPRPENQE